VIDPAQLGPRTSGCIEAASGEMKGLSERYDSRDKRIEFVRANKPATVAGDGPLTLSAFRVLLGTR